MKLNIWKKVIAVVALGLFAQFSVADNGAAGKIAGIVKEVNHFPSDSQKETLNEIARDSSNSEAIRTIAEAVHDMQHAVSADHKAALAEIAEDDSVTAEERELATIVADFNHMASEDTKARLAEIE